MNETKICPYCGEEVLSAAKKCRRCGEWLDRTAEVAKSQTADTDEMTITNASDDTEEQTEIEKIGFRLGQWIGRAILLGIILWIVGANVPDHEDHDKAIHEDARDCIRDKGASAVDLFIPGLGTLLGAIADNATVDKSLDELFDAMNKIKVDESWFWSTGYIVNGSYPEGTPVSFGICGMVFPYVSWDDIRIMSDKDKSEMFGDSTNDNSPDATTKSEESEASPDDEPSSSQITDWSMIEPVKLGSDEAYQEWSDSHSELTHLTAEGDIDGYPIKIDVMHGDSRIVGRYHNGSLSLDLNGTSIGNTMYLQIGHGSEMSHAVLRKDDSTEHTWRGTWGHMGKPMQLVFSE